jgi:putative aldouronate transport system substrate-binding protein
MRTPWKRTLRALVAGGLAVTLVACGGESSTEDPTTAVAEKNAASMAEFAADQQFTATEPFTISTLYSDHPNYAMNPDWLLWSEITQRTNVTLEPTIVPMSDYDQKKSLLIGAGDAPMIIPKTYPGQEQAFVASGAIVPVSDYLDLMPNFQQKVADWNLEPELDTLRQADGKFYLLPGLHEEPWQDYSIAYRTDELDRLGLQAPTTWDELRTVLAAIKQAHPDGYPLSDRFKGDSILAIAGPGFGTSAGWGLKTNLATFNSETNAFEYTGATEEYKALVTYFRTLVEQGLLDPESFTQDDDSAIQKFSTGNSFAISANAQTIPNNLEPGIAGIPGATVSKGVVPAGPAGDLLQPSRLENGLMVTKQALDSPNFVAIMQFIDWLWYSDEGQEFVKWGVLGTTFDKDTAGVRTLNPEVTFAGINAGAPKHLQKDFGFSGGNFAYGGTTDLLWSTFTPAELEFQKTNEGRKEVALPPPHPFDDIDREQATLYESALNDLTKQSTLQFILGDRDLATWDAYLQELEAKGMSQYVDMVNAAHQAYNEANG